MQTILDELVDGAREETNLRKRQVSLRELEGRFGPQGPSLIEALRAPGLGIIAESKKASPSQGVIRKEYSAARNAELYQKGGADGMSVLTEPRQFLGSLDHLSEARAVCTLPLLRKDFIVDEYQLFEARAFGASAVLLIAAVLDRHHLNDLVHAATDLGLECLVELYAASELDRVDFDSVRLLGVNNRDLRTFEVDIRHAPEVLRSVPAGVIRVAESGLRTAEDLAFVYEQGIDAVLIGEAFMRAPDPGQALKDLREQTARLIEDAGL